MSKNTDKIEADVSKFARAIALKRAAITAVITFVLAFAVREGWIIPSASDDLAQFVQDAIGLVGVIGAGAWIRKDVTPADVKLGPVDSNGNRLVPEVQALYASVQSTSAPEPMTADEIHAVLGTVPVSPYDELTASSHPEPSATHPDGEPVPAVDEPAAPTLPGFTQAG